MDALLDTGSAVNIVSEATFKRIDADSVKMQVPTLKLIDFNKQEIPVIAQAQVTVAVGETELSLPMFVHDQMDLPCLLGFEASVALGLIKVKPGVELRETTQDVAAVAVKLVESCRLLPDHAAWARVKIDGGWTAIQLLTVQQDKTGSDEADTVVEDALLEPDVNGRARILLTNVSGKPVELKKSANVKYNVPTSCVHSHTCPRRRYPSRTWYSGVLGALPPLTLHPETYQNQNNSRLPSVPRISH